MSLLENFLPRYCPIDKARRDNLCNKAKYLQLVDFSGKSPESFVEYCASQKRSWPNLYMETPEDEMREKYKEWKRYLRSWCGFIMNNEVVSVSPLMGDGFSNGILLKKLPQSEKIQDDEISIAIFSELSLFRKEIQLQCKVLATRTIIVPEDPVLRELGERPGTYYKTMSLGWLHFGKDLVDLKIANNGIFIGNSFFRFTPSPQ